MSDSSNIDKKYNIKETLDEAVKRGIDVSEARHWLDAKGYYGGLLEMKF